MESLGIRNMCFVEQKEYSLKEFSDRYQGNLDEYLFERGLCSRVGNIISFRFTGFALNHNEVIVVFPKGYSIPTDPERIKKEAFTLARVLLRYRNEVDMDKEEKELLGSPDDIRPYGISAALAIITDYERYKLIRRQRTIYRSNMGNNVDWNRTVKTRTPLISGGQPIYDSVVSRRSNMDHNNLIYKIHKYAVQKSYSKYGWLLDRHGIDEDPDFDELPCDEKTAVYELNKELKVTYSDREINLIKALTEFIVGSGNNERRDILETLATPHFHTVWEAICKSIYKSQHALYWRDLPRPVWHWGNKVSKTVQIPDILFKDNNEMFILDAKYYDTEQNLPGWHDLVKQFYYYYSLIGRYDYSIRNALIFPGNQVDSVVHSGHVDIEGIPELGRVEAFNINCYEAMKCYSEFNQGNFRKITMEMLRNVEAPLVV